MLHYGVQNILDPALDEWAVMESIENIPGEINFPDECEEIRLECEAMDSVFENEGGIFCK